MSIIGVKDFQSFPPQLLTYFILQTLISKKIKIKY